MYEILSEIKRSDIFLMNLFVTTKYYERVLFCAIPSNQQNVEIYIAISNVEICKHNLKNTFRH